MKYQKLSKKNKMFWFVEYCNLYNLYLIGEKIFDKYGLVGSVDFDNSTVTIGKEKYLFRHFAVAIIENVKIHGDR